MTDQLHRFPGSRRLLMHADAGRRARSVRALAGAADWRRRLADRIGSTGVAMTGPSAWPPAAPWPWPALSPTDIVEQLGSSYVGIRLIGAAVPRQAGRHRLSLLCRYGGNSVVVKLGSPSPTESLRTEATVLELLTTRPLPGIDTPHVIGFGQVVAGEHAIDALVTSSIALHRQRPAFNVPLRTFETDLTNRLSELDDVNAHQPGMVPSHGDLTPWNLRRTGRGLALFDWESAGWRPAGTDLAHYNTCCDELRSSSRRRSP